MYVQILWESARILLAEVVIDILKHAVLGKFNDMRPGIYKEYMKVRQGPNKKYA